MMATVIISERVSLPIPETSSMVVSMDDCKMGSGLKNRVMTSHEANSMITQNESPSIDHSTKFIFTPNNDENSPTVITLQPLPVITAHPPAYDAQGMAIIMALPMGDFNFSAPFNSNKRFPTEINTPQAATSDMKKERNAVAHMKPSSILLVSVPDHLSTKAAMRVGMVVASRATVNANVPMRKNTVDPMALEYASSNEHTPMMGIMMSTSSAVAGNGSDSVTHRRMPAAKIPKTMRPS